MKCLSALAVLLTSVTVSHQAAAAPITLFDSLPSANGADFSGQMVSTPNSYGAPGIFRVYDEFSLGTAATISSADFVVYSYGSLPSQADLGIYSVVNGAAGNALFSQIVTATVSGAVTDPNSPNLYRVSVTPTAIDLAAGSYFISLAGVGYDDFPIATFSAADSANPVTAGAYSYQSGSNDHSGIAAYRIEGNVDAAVPEPSVLVLFGLGAAAAFAARRRKQG